MEIQRTENELIIRLPKEVNINMEYLQKLLDYLRFIEISTKSQATEKQIQELTKDINKSWWQTNKNKFI